MSDDAFSQILAKLTEIDQRLTARLTEAEQTLTAQMDKQFERVFSRLTAVANHLHNLRCEHSVTHDLLTNLPATLRRAIQERLRQLDDREPAP
jgi:hypothetical protein